ncbi:hypothetical protein IW261DRAFT_1612916 [Armillaria novae-zelandiae]|uniref:Uncharacterized protein n=1 Tax=Armillaria novae-zelandiae TaxID=153914 RepID=A0AA39NLA6_9AGAR|nr:hypothetical protein IW261DRAFT_1612916 [Armillaria novae-zelandiae]
MISDPERMHELYHLPSILLPDDVSDLDTLYCPNTHFHLYPCSPPRLPAHEQCMYTEESLLLEKTSGLYLASLSRIVPLLSSTEPPATLTLHEKLCRGFHEEHVTHVWTATLDSQPIIAKIFDPLYFIDPYKGTDPFPLLDLSCRGLFLSPLPSQGNRTVYILLLEHVAGQDMHYLVPAPVSPSLCLAHHTAIVDVFYDILMCGVKQHDMAPRNLIIWPPKRGGIPFCDKENCPVCCSVDPDHVESVMIDFEGSELWDPDHEFYDEQMREREVRTLREDYMEDWWYGKYGV